MDPAAKSSAIATLSGVAWSFNSWYAGVVIALLVLIIPKNMIKMCVLVQRVLLVFACPWRVAGPYLCYWLIYWPLTNATGQFYWSLVTLLVTYSTGHSTDSDTTSPQIVR
jgi:hypothetical protein